MIKVGDLVTLINKTTMSKNPVLNESMLDWEEGIVMSISQTHYGVAYEVSSKVGEWWYPAHYIDIHEKYQTLLAELL